MKKLAMLLCVILGLMVCACAQAQVFTFNNIHATFDIKEDAWILLTPSNLSLHQEWIAAEVTTEQELQEKWKAEGVLLVADALNGSARVTVTAVPDQDGLYDLDQHTVKTRNAYAARYNNGTPGENGITWQGGTWKLRTSHGRFLIIKYKQTVNGVVVHRGYRWQTVRNGYQVAVDYQVTDRSLRSADGTTMENLMRGFTFTEVLEKPADAVQKAVFTQTPPLETNSDTFTVTGTCDPGLTLLGTLLRMTSASPVNFTTTSDASGKFSMKVTMPSEGVWLMSITVLNGDTVVQEELFEATTYSATMIPVNLENEITDTLTSDTLLIKGVTGRQVTVQCIVGSTYYKEIKTNNSGGFSFKIDTSKEGTYDITLVFSKKGMTTRRFTYLATRSLSEAEQRAQVIATAVKPGYGTLTDKLEGYTGRVMRYPLYITEIRQVGSEWIVTAAMNRTKSGKCSNFMYIMCEEEPTFEVGTQQTMVGTCIGSYTNTDGETVQSYPAFDLLFWDN